MSNTVPVLSWSEVTRTTIDEREASSLDSVDLGFGNVLVAALRGVTVSRPGAAFDAVRAFLARPTREQIIKSPYSDPRTFMKALRAAGRGRASESKLGEIVNKSALPIVMFQRDLAHSVYEGDRYAPVRDWNQLSFDDGSAAVINQYHLTTSYRVAILAWDLESLDILSAALGSWFRNHAGQFGFKAHLYNTPIDAFADVVTRTVLWEDISPGVETDRLMGLACTIEVIAEAFEAQGVNELTSHYVLMEPQPLFGGV